MSQLKKIKPEIEFLQEIKNEFATAEYGEGMSVNLHGIKTTINDRINHIKELSKQNINTKIKLIDTNTPPKHNNIDAKVVLLTTEEIAKKGDLMINKTRKDLFIAECDAFESFKKHIYITSDEEINEGDWYLSKVNNKPCKWTKDYSGTNGYGFKIIATTDKDINEPDKNIKNITYALLPEPSKEFIQDYIEAYNNGNPITDILVEYEVNVLMEDGDALSNMFKLKTKKDNTITISLKEDRLFTYKEMRSKAVDFAYYIHLQKLGDCSHEKHKELFDEYIEPKL